MESLDERARGNATATETVSTTAAASSLRAQRRAYHDLYIARAALGLVMVTVALCGALANRVGLFDHPWTRLSFDYIAQLATFLAFLFALWWRIPWYASGSILALLYLLSGFTSPNPQLARLATTSIAVIAGVLVQQLSRLRAAAAPPLDTDLDDESIAWLDDDDVTSDEGLRARLAALQRELDLAHAEKRELASCNQSLAEFTTSASHDLRTPLRAIHGFGRVLLEDHGVDLAPRAADYVRRMLDATERLEQLVDALLELGRVSRGCVQARPLDLAALAREIVDAFRVASPERCVELIVPPRLAACADPVLVRIVMTNLLSNAWKFTGPRADARIEVGLDTRDGVTAFYVRDNGVGFDGAKARTIFRPFERLHSATEFEGSGVGLATVERVIERHGGRVWAHGAEGRGATVFFTLPRSDS